MDSPPNLLLPFAFRKPRAKPVYKGHAKFTPQEDFRLCHLVRDHGANNWRLIAQYMPGRNSRQCRERWLNYLNPELNVHPWTPAEDALLEEEYQQLRGRWMLLLPCLPCRTDGMIKNWFQLLQRKPKRRQRRRHRSKLVHNPPITFTSCLMRFQTVRRTVRSSSVVFGTSSSQAVGGRNDHSGIFSVWRTDRKLRGCFAGQLKVEGEFHPTEMGTTNKTGWNLHLLGQ
jgi:hypothetical protein